MTTSTSTKVEIHVYTQGACNDGRTGCAVVILNDRTIHEQKQFVGPGTTHTAALSAILMAAKSVPTDHPVRIYSDSSYAIGALMGRTKSKVNLELITEVRDALAQFRDWKLIHGADPNGFKFDKKARELARHTIR